MFPIKGNFDGPGGECLVLISLVVEMISMRMKNRSASERNILSDLKVCVFDVLQMMKEVFLIYKKSVC